MYFLVFSVKFIVRESVVVQSDKERRSRDLIKDGLSDEVVGTSNAREGTVSPCPTHRLFIATALVFKERSFSSFHPEVKMC